MTQLMILRVIFIYLNNALYHLHVISDLFSNIFLQNTQKNSAILQAVKFKIVGIGNFKAHFSKSHFQRIRLRSYTQMIISLKNRT